jgi:hypothetical protein
MSVARRVPARAVLGGCALVAALWGDPSSATSVRRSGQDAELVLTARAFGQLTNIPVGRTVRIPRPLDVERWQVDFAGEILQLLNPPDKRQTPGPDGWRFRARAAGETDVALTERPPSSVKDGPPPRRFVLTVRVSKR